MSRGLVGPCGPAAAFMGLKSAVSEGLGSSSQGRWVQTGTCVEYTSWSEKCELKSDIKNDAWISFYIMLSKTAL